MPCADNNFISVTMLLVTLSVSHKLHMIAHAHPGLECGWAYVILGRNSYTPNCPTWSQVLGPLCMPTVVSLRNLECRGMFLN